MLSIIFPYIYFLCTGTVQKTEYAEKESKESAAMKQLSVLFHLFLRSKILLVQKQFFSQGISESPYRDLPDKLAAEPYPAHSE